MSAWHNALPTANAVVTTPESALTQAPIESLQLGQRVVAFNPDRHDIDRDEAPVDPATWREVRLIAPYQGHQLFQSLK